MVISFLKWLKSFDKTNKYDHSSFYFHFSKALKNENIYIYIYIICTLQKAPEPVIELNLFVSVCFWHLDGSLFCFF